MGSLIPPALKRWLRFGSGPGIVIEGSHLDVVLTKVRPTGPQILGTLRMEDFRERPAAEWGGEYAAFLEQYASSHVPALLVLPREEVVLRQVTLPGVKDEEAAAALRFQLDTLHPFGDEEIYFDWQRLGGSSHFAIAITQKSRLDAYLSLFSEAGIKLSGVTFSGAAMFAAIHLFDDQLAPTALAIREIDSLGDGPVEVYGESETRPLFSAEFDEPLPRAVALSRAELRLDPETEAADWADCLPGPQRAPAEFDFSRPATARRALAYAASLAAACPHLQGSLNLLPAEARQTSSRALYIPSVVLGVLLLVMGTALILEGAWIDRDYQKRLDLEAKRYSPAMRQVEHIDERTADMAERIRQLDAYRGLSRKDLDIVLEVNKLLPPPAYVQQLQIDEKYVNVAGEAEQAEGVLKAFDNSKLFQNSEFVTPINTAAGGGGFRLRAEREAGAR